MIELPLRRRGQKEGAVTYWRLAHRYYPEAKSNKGEVVQMGNGRWTNVLRFVVCVVVTLMVMLLTAPTAC